MYHRTDGRFDLNFKTVYISINDMSSNYSNLFIVAIGGSHNVIKHFYAVFIVLRQWLA